MKRFTRAVALILILTPMLVTSTPPAIQRFIFEVDGHIVRQSGSLANHAVVLLGRCSSNVWDQILVRCYGEGEGAEDYGPFVTTDLTSADGGFSLRVSVCGSGYPYCDTLAVGVVYPDTTIVGTPFAFNIVKPAEIEKTGHTEDPGFLCDGETEYTYVDAYIYHYPPDTVTVP